MQAAAHQAEAFQQRVMGASAAKAPVAAQKDSFHGIPERSGLLLPQHGHGLPGKQTAAMPVPRHESFDGSVLSWGLWRGEQARVIFGVCFLHGWTCISRDFILSYNIKLARNFMAWFDVVFVLSNYSIINEPLPKKWSLLLKQISILDHISPIRNLFFILFHHIISYQNDNCYSITSDHLFHHIISGRGMVLVHHIVSYRIGAPFSLDHGNSIYWHRPGFPRS